MSELSKALLAAQKEIKAVGKGSTNSFHRYQYVSGDHMVAECREALHKHGLTVTSARETTLHLDTDPPTSNIGFVLRHESGESCEFWYLMPVIAEKGRPLDKALLGTRTTTLSYFLRDLLLIPRLDENEIDRRDDTEHEPSRPVAVETLRIGNLKRHHPPKHELAKPVAVETLGDWGTEVIAKIEALGVTEAALRGKMKKSGVDVADNPPSEWPATTRKRLATFLEQLEKTNGDS